MYAQTDPALPRHRKMLRFLKRTELDLRSALGTLNLLWIFGLEFAQDGDITKFSADEIAAAIHWTGEPAEIVEALIHAEFLERSEGRLSIRSWTEWTGHIFAKRKADRDRKRDERTKKQDQGAKNKKPTKQKA